MPLEWPTLQRPRRSAQHLPSGLLGRGVCLPIGPLGWGVSVCGGEPSAAISVALEGMFFGTRRAAPAPWYVCDTLRAAKRATSGHVERTRAGTGLAVWCGRLEAMQR